MKHHTIMILSTLLLVGCPDEKNGEQSGCPSSRPSQGASCSTAGQKCTFELFQKCPCGPSDIYWNCSCTSGSWDCGHGHDCYPCDGGTVDATPADPDSGPDVGPDMPLADSQAPDLGAVTASSWVTIKPGSFTMGSPKDEPCREAEGLKEDQHQVTLTRSFEIPTTEVTQGQFAALMWYNPSKHQACGKDCPVEMVNWHEAVAYCNALSAKKGLAKCYSCKGMGKGISCVEAKAYSAGKVYDCPGYRLPTDAEWEYAYRAGTTTALYNGKIEKCLDKDPNADKIGWHTKISGGKSHPVAQLQPNAWGLYDMPGNVREWCHEWMINSLGTTASTDPWGQNTEFIYRIIRGGSWWGKPLGLRAAHRFNKASHYRCHGIGFRCVRTTKK